MEVIEKLYSIDGTGQTAQYDELKADITSWYEWDEIDDTTESNKTIFKKYLDSSGADYVAIELSKSTSSYGVMISAKQMKSGTTYSGVTHGGGTGRYARYVVAVKTDYGIIMILAHQSLPSTTSVNNISTVFGVVSSTNAVSGNKSVCLFAEQLSSSVNSNVFGESTTSQNSDPALSAQSTTEMIAVTPVLTRYSSDIPDNVYRMILTTDGMRSCNNEILFNGNKYRRLADILIPAE